MSDAGAAGPDARAVDARAPRALSSRLIPIACGAVLLAVLAGLAYNLIGFPGLRAIGDYYRIDLDVYRLGGGVFMSGTPLYGEMPPTALGNTLPFTYPPISAVIFGPLSLMSLHWAGIVVTCLSLALLFGTIVLTLVSLGYSPRTLLLWAAGAVFAAAMILEPVFSTFDYGQINIVLMAFVAADCLPRKTPWPRGLLIGFVAAVKLTPAVFVLFFLFRKDFRAAVVSGISFLAFTALGFAATFSDSLQYWTKVLVDSDRIGRPAYPANQSITGMLARLGLDETIRSVGWIALSLVLLGVTFYAMRRAFAAHQTALALGVNAMFGLLVSPVSWSHHWVWTVPLLVALGTLAYRTRNVVALGFVGIGAVVLHFAPHWQLAVGRWSGLGWPLWDQVVASSYVWWGTAAIVVAAWATRPSTRLDRTTEKATDLEPA
ncbi:glycosyltransferase 87 family protein [Rhodococcoides kyotonense]|uniref:Alpha-1,2-mannosyltransferase n=1 Tax=Rhodococcoides kyotonense TaxID=398843 RepID=A0A239KX62_9NOCA|nr:alpha-1,2-mannosyltransferase [Rhodococcus kyotonensis]